MEVIYWIFKVVGIMIALFGVAFLYAVSQYRKEDCWDNGDEEDSEEALCRHTQHPEHSHMFVNQKGVLEELGYHDKNGYYKEGGPVEPDTSEEVCPLCLMSSYENHDAMYKDIDPKHLCRCKDCGRVYDVLPDDF